MHLAVLTRFQKFIKKIELNTWEASNQQIMFCMIRSVGGGAGGRVEAGLNRDTILQCCSIDRKNNVKLGPLFMFQFCSPKWSLISKAWLSQVRAHYLELAKDGLESFCYGDFRSANTGSIFPRKCWDTYFLQICFGENCIVDPLDPKTFLRNFGTFPDLDRSERPEAIRAF